MWIRTALVVGTVVSAVLCGSFFNLLPGTHGVESPKGSLPRRPAADERAIAEAGNRFAFELYQRLRTAESGNLFFSPASISAALAMTHAGADGRTAREMAEVLHFTLPEERLHAAYASFLARLNQGDQRAYELRIANRLWGQEGFGFLPTYLQVSRRDYGAELAEVDFASATEAARRQINAWVAQQTEEKIQDLIPAGMLNSLTRLVLTNAIYFKGQWSSPFKAQATTNAPFMVSPDQQVDVPLMAQQGSFSYAATDELQILELPYEGGDLSMLVLLPRRADGLAELEQWLTAEALSEWSAALAKRQVQVYLPRFRLTSQFNLSATLAALGMPTAFDKSAADFSRMSDEDELHIQAVVHKAFVDVNEEGTEAAAATGVVVVTSSAPPEPETFRADHPFAFLIRDNATGGVLFLGRVTNPNE